MDEVKLWRTMVILDITPGIQTFYVVIVLGLSVLERCYVGFWAVSSIKFEYRWKTGDGNTVRFWEDR
jgi:hypothetical protein